MELMKESNMYDHRELTKARVLIKRESGEEVETRLTHLRHLD